MEKNKIEKFVNYGNKLPEDAVGCITVGQLMASLLVIALGHNYIISFFSVIPFIVSSIILYCIYRKINKNEKMLFLFFGIQAIVISFTLQMGSLVFAPLNKDQIIVLLLVSLAINLIIPILMILVAKLMISSKRELPAAASAIAIGPFAAIGYALSRVSKNNSNLFYSYIFLLLAAVFLVFFIYIIKYYYACVLERMEEGNTQGDDKTGDG